MEKMHLHCIDSHSGVQQHTRSETLIARSPAKLFLVQNEGQTYKGQLLQFSVVSSVCALKKIFVRSSITERF